MTINYQGKAQSSYTAITTQEMPGRYSSFHLIMLIKRLDWNIDKCEGEYDYHTSDANISSGMVGLCLEKKSKLSLLL